MPPYTHLHTELSTNPVKQRGIYHNRSVHLLNRDCAFPLASPPRPSDNPRGLRMHKRFRRSVVRSVRRGFWDSGKAVGIVLTIIVVGYCRHHPIEIERFIGMIDKREPVPCLLQRAHVWGHTPLPELLGELITADEPADGNGRQCARANGAVQTDVYVGRGDSDYVSGAGHYAGAIKQRARQQRARRRIINCLADNRG